MIDTNHYQTLEISQQATQQEIKNAYRRLVKQFHPDSLEETASHERIIEINAAYEILGDPKHRQVYDRQINQSENYLVATQRQQRTADAQKQYQRDRAAQKDTEFYISQWYQKIYLPLNRLINQILNSLPKKIEDLSADPFDDELMEQFQAYLEKCRTHLQKAKQIFSSQPNPSKLAKAAAHFYHCLNQISDGIDELERFTLSYDDHALHTGQELFRIASSLKREAQHATLKYYSQ
ncbi:molecular chaperone DnaJ [Aphanothece hegewaldii CCALA 016]|uniref:Molecular chaperone DnaJ n=1 Tax=Aphanothece hegewaldii CCALA 016 TaxID=2107694 RepID=A0A2T1LXS8_9CHRO|nr:DnaJ domain-containing protein [Aphanothece hegewaldii]PSF37187.1 molecular chaperone DnaJ [Aphanothece hegewaldii CCALA 016]